MTLMEALIWTLLKICAIVQQLKDNKCFKSARVILNVLYNEKDSHGRFSVHLGWAVNEVVSRDSDLKDPKYVSARIELELLLKARDLFRDPDADTEKQSLSRRVASDEMPHSTTLE